MLWLDRLPRAGSLHSDERAQGKDAIVGPGEGWELGLAEGVDSGRGEVVVILIGVEGDAGKVAERRLGREAPASLAWPLFHWLEEDGAVAGGGGDFRGVLEDDGPGGGVFAVPEVVFFRFLSGEVAGFVPEVADGAVFGWAEVGARVGLFVVSHCGGEEGGEIVWIFDKDGLQGEAAILIKLANVLGGEAGGFF